MRQAYPNFQIIVSDNYSTDNTKEVVDRFADPRVRYINTGRRLSMSGNFEFALGHVADGFVMFIGSDDGIMPDAIEYVDSIVRTYDVGAVSCRQATYVWPNFPDKGIAGRLIFRGSRDDVEIRKSSEWIKKTLNFQVLYCFDLPNLYCGFVHKNVINKAYKDGKYFRSITPDAYSAFATAIFVDEYAFSHKPFSIAGASAKSNGASAMHPAGDSGEASKFYSENDIDVCDGFVKCPSYEIICAEAFAKLAQAFPEVCAPYRIDYAGMLRAALENANEKTEQDIRVAVAIMAANFGVKAESLPASPASGMRKMKLADAFRAMRMAMAPNRIVAVEHSEDIGVKNIDDAALVAHVLNQRHVGETFTTSKGLVRQRLRKLIGF
jgi:hypothetical protein